MSRSVRKIGSAARRVVALALQLAALSVCAAAQSSDPELPTPALSGEIAGRIAPRDVGDPRRTRHFYTFGARQGDLELTVEGNNLEGEVDLFAAVTLRPLAKVTLYAGLGSAVTRTVFLRRAETLVLRVQARTPNDAEGSYRVRLGGTFVPAVAASTPSEPPPEESAAASLPRPAAGRRVTSTGARIEEPRPEPTTEVAAAEPEPTPEPAATPTPRRTMRGGAGNTRRGGSRAGTTTGRTNRDSGRARDETAARDDAPTETSPTTTPEEAAPVRTPARPSRGRTTRGRAGAQARRGGQQPPDSAPNAVTTEPAAPAPTGLELPGTRLVLELRDGGRVEREMSEVRRVTVERGLIVILLRSGQVERQPLANVLRMSIEP